MSRFTVAVTVPGPAGEAQALWLDTRRWPAFRDGFGSIHKLDDAWPRAGRVVWVSGPNGRGRVAETMLRHGIGTEHEVEIEDEKLGGRETVTFAPLEGGAVQVTVRFDYQLKDRSPIMRLAGIYVRQRQRESLQRSLRRFALERESDVSSGG